jgi:hypothetical protein
MVLTLRALNIALLWSSLWVEISALAYEAKTLS